MGKNKKSRKSKESTKKQWYKKLDTYLWLILILFVVGVLFFGTRKQNVNAEASFEETSYSWGDIPIQGGNVEYEFTLNNTGTDDLTVYPMETSCHCTNAQLVTSSANGPLYTMLNDRSRDNTWRGTVPAGEEAIIKVIYDPLYHGPNAFGPITRTITVPTSSGSFELRVDGNVIPGAISQTIDKGYENISPQRLNSTLSTSDTFLLDVHVPEQAHIDGTDEFIEYTKISENLDKLPSDKDTEITVYCRSGSMSTQVSAQLAKLGYTNIKNLEGGTIAWKDAGFNVN